VTGPQPGADARPDRRPHPLHRPRPVDELLAAGHTVAVVHGGEHEPDLPPEVEHIHTPRRDLPAQRGAIARFAPAKPSITALLTTGSIQ
jgi:hypothetical protein